MSDLVFQLFGIQLLPAIYQFLDSKISWSPFS